jgi:hypothetical protein
VKRSSATSVRLERTSRAMKFVGSSAELEAIRQTASERGYSFSRLVREIVHTARGRQTVEEAAEASSLELVAWVRAVVLATIGYTPLEDQLARSRKHLRLLTGPGPGNGMPPKRKAARDGL